MPKTPKNNIPAPRPQRKTRQGLVVSDRMDKSIVVRVERTIEHPLYKKIIRRSKRYHVHDASNQCKIGDTVNIMECRPLSRTKRWRLLKILSSSASTRLPAKKAS